MKIILLLTTFLSLSQVHAQSITNEELLQSHIQNEAEFNPILGKNYKCISQIKLKKAYWIWGNFEIDGKATGCQVSALSQGLNVNNRSAISVKNYSLVFKEYVKEGIYIEKEKFEKNALTGENEQIGTKTELSHYGIVDRVAGGEGNHSFKLYKNEESNGEFIFLDSFSYDLNSKSYKVIYICKSLTLDDSDYLTCIMNASYNALNKILPVVNNSLVVFKAE